MPMYVCHVGEAASVAQDEPGCFLVTDEKDRQWYCRMIPEADEEYFDPAEEAYYFGALALKCGFAHGGRFVYGTWTDEASLRKGLKNQ
jgi:hypothetical protein